MFNMQSELKKRSSESAFKNSITPLKNRTNLRIYEGLSLASYYSQSNMVIDFFVLILHLLLNSMVTKNITNYQS